MKPIMIGSIKLIFFSMVLAACTAITAFGQSARLQLDHLDRLNSIADQSVDVTVDQKVLNLAKIFLAKTKDPEQQKVRELIGEIEGIYVKHFKFESAGQYSLSDIETIRTQLNGPGWSRMAGVRSKRNKQNLDVYTMIQGSRIGGLAVIAAEEKELTVVNIIGPIDLEKLMALEGSFSIPSLEIERIKEKTQKE
jgi:Domain of unknown function (DUF4252)